MRAKEAVTGEKNKNKKKLATREKEAAAKAKKTNISKDIIHE